MTKAGSPLALTMGDPAGLGPELTLAAWQHFRQANGPVFCSISNADLLRRTAPDIPIKVIKDVRDAKDFFSAALPVVDIGLKIEEVAPGQPNRSSADAVIQSIDTAVNLARSGTVAGVVTNPIHKASLQESGFAFPGHTEYLAHLCGENGTQPTSVMMLVIPGLRVVPLTIHLALSQIPAALSIDLIVKRAQIVADALARDFNLKVPKLGIAALNPHGGEDGKFGEEEQTLIAPAVAQLRADGMAIDGPFPADTLFAEHVRQRFDAILCMYHDQALIPIKALNFYQGVNVTLGLSIVRTSPDHGTGFDIAGKNSADPQSLCEAITLAQQLAENRANRSA